MGAGLDAHRAHAQQAESPLGQPAMLNGVEILATSYLWFPWTSINVRPSDTRLSSASITIGPSDLYNRLTWVSFLEAAEFRSEPFGVILDYLHTPVKSGIATRDILFKDAQGISRSILGLRCFSTGRSRHPTGTWIWVRASGHEA